MGYWGTVYRRAFREALDQIKWTSPMKAAQSIVPTVASGAVTWAVGGTPAYGALGAIGGVLLVGAAWIAEGLWRIPPQMDAELRANVKAEEEEHDRAERKRRRELMDTLCYLYATQLPDEHEAREISLGLRMPPEEWLNEKLAEYGEAWSVLNINGTNYQTFEVKALSPEERAEYAAKPA